MPDLSIIKAADTKGKEKRKKKGQSEWNEEIQKQKDAAAQLTLTVTYCGGHHCNCYNSDFKNLFLFVKKEHSIKYFL